MSDNLGEGFNLEEKEFLTFPSPEFDAYLNEAFPPGDTTKPPMMLLDNGQINPLWQDRYGTPENAPDRGDGFDFDPEFTPGFISVGDGESDKEKSNTNTRRSTPYRNPLRKIANGGVLQYPIDLDTDLQDYFEIQIFRYRAAGGLPGIKQGNQGYEKDKVKKFKKVNNSFETGGYLSASNRRGNRQNFRLQDLQSTIQLPIPPSLKDMNSVDFTGGTMSGLAAVSYTHLTLPTKRIV